MSFRDKIENIVRRPEVAETVEQLSDSPCEIEVIEDNSDKWLESNHLKCVTHGRIILTSRPVDEVKSCRIGDKERQTGDEGGSQ